MRTDAYSDHPNGDCHSRSRDREAQRLRPRHSATRPRAPRCRSCRFRARLSLRSAPIGSRRFAATNGAALHSAADHQAAGLLPPRGVLDRRTGADGKTYGIGFALALPGDWNGRFLFQGGGGLNGTVRLPLGNTAAGRQTALARGFAVVSTDTGHKGQAFDATFMQEQQASLDFAYQAIGRVAELAKQIVAQHYGKPADHSYFAGCSTGGREAC